ncbi:MAG: SPOR domain-containing protein [Rhodobacteraceae bacterium]|nr:SPOR domain-containing protein [Paracoccaceae bacterium]
MQLRRAVSTAIFVALAASGLAEAQRLPDITGPKEPPPHGFAGRQYVDSAGCVFVRAGVNGQVIWVPRVDRNRKLVCGYPPSVASAAPQPVASAQPVADAAPPAPVTLTAPPPVATARPQRAAAPTPAGSVSLVRSRPVAAAETLCPEPPETAHRYLLGDGRRVTRCRGAGGDDVDYLNSLAAPGLVVNRREPSAVETRRALNAERGDYRVTWVKGRLDPAKAAQQTRQPSKPAKVSAGSAAQAYVQVGVFGEPANAERAISLLKAQGFRVATAQSRQGQRPLRMVLAGPFADPADLSDALAFARRSGYPDAFIRR